MASCIRCSTQWMWSLFTTKSLLMSILMTSKLERSKEFYVEPGSPAEILNLHPLLGDDGGVHIVVQYFIYLGN